MGSISRRIKRNIAKNVCRYNNIKPNKKYNIGKEKQSGVKIAYDKIFGINKEEKENEK